MIEMILIRKKERKKKKTYLDRKKKSGPTKERFLNRNEWIVLRSVVAGRGMRWGHSVI